MLKFLKNYILNQPKKMISYHDYMSIVLYDEQHGYYMSGNKKIGKEGDFYTSSNISDAFARIVARLCIKVWQNSSLLPQVVELGGGNGRFARLFLKEIEALDEIVYSKLHYYMIDTSPYHRYLQAKEVPKDKVTLLEDLSQLSSPFNGIVFSNEFFDAFPVHVIEKQEGTIYEIFVAFEEDNLVEVSVPVSNEDITEYLIDNEIVLTEGQRFEVPLAMINYIKSLSSKLNQALILTIDYGYSKEEWQNPIHHSGSLRGYYKHQLINNPLAYPFQMDLTTHIHFDSLVKYGEKFGLDYLTKLRQDEFLLQNGILDLLQENFDTDPFSEKSKQNRAIRSLIMSGGISQFFYVIMQQKNIELREEQIFQELRI
ncbi:SAM-dependent methyltransferase [Bacillus sp. HMF5848]|uniref:class I SAM-dependent methyltransferase n=1 Tax=Bacillus sp. HMF5848 TaxID=2495421 RepID=UPI000F7777F5|nr:SAM-dependent methyltransferase [Bacillus sp. HMF5848]RSK27835.1 SAM-dependent methyltransferase [Bacillus sp. HMF5848]